MKRTSVPFFVLLINLSLGQSRTGLFDVDVRVRVVNDDLLYVVVQIDNNSGRSVTELEGYITEVDPSNAIVSEQRITHLHRYEPSLRDGQTVTRGVTYPFDRTHDFRYRYHISHLKFKNDPRIFLYSPAGELLRIQ